MLWKTNDKLFEQLFQRHIAYSVDAGRELVKLFEHLPDADRQTQRIMELEHDADRLIGEGHQLIDRTFITRLDKSDIIELMGELDHVIDYMKATANRLRIYRIGKGRVEALEFAKVICRMTEIIKSALDDIGRLELAKVQKQVVAIKELEEEADHLLYHALERLFLEAKDWREAMQWKDIFERLENVTDHCEDVVNVLSTIARKEAS